MKRCPACLRVYADEALKLCAKDGSVLVEESVASTGAAADDARANNSSRRGLVVILSMFVVGCLTAGLILYLDTHYGKVAVESVAVLPFENQTRDTDAEYLSDGLTESLIYRLSELPNLRVSPRGAVFRYKGKETDPLRAGSELGVDAVLSGRIVERGGQLLISAELVDVRHNKLLWGEQYDRKASDLLAVQRQIAQEIIYNLRPRLSGAERSRVNKPDTNDPEAYRLYLLGRYHSLKFTKDGYLKGLDYFNQSIEKDPAFALAYVGIANAYDMAGDRYLSPQEVMPKAEEAVRKALELDDAIAEAHLQRARIEWTYSWNWTSAEAEFRRAVELKQADSDAHGDYGEFLTSMKRFGEANARLKRAQELAPLSPLTAARSGLPFYFAREYDRSIKRFRQSVELDPNFWYGQYFLGLAYEQKGAYTDAAFALKEAERLSDTPEVAAALGHLYAVSGKRDDARRVLDALKAQSKQRYVSPYDAALIYTALGDKEQAFAALQRAYEERTSRMAMYLNVDPRLDALRTDPRFADLTRKIGL